MNEELKKAWDEVLFWAKRCSYASAESHPEWFEKLDLARARRDRIKEELKRHETA